MAEGEEEKLKMEGVKLILLDIEGTVCPISYVKDTLFPYATKALPDVLASKWGSEDFAPYRNAAPEEAQKSPEAYKSAVDTLTASNSKVPWLKNLQGYLWEDGYKTGAYSTPLFRDVAPRLKAWAEKEGLQLAIYSSGSVFAQKLLFAHVQAEREREAEGKLDETTASTTNRKRGRSDDEAEDLADGAGVPSKKRVLDDGEGEATAGAADKDDVDGEEDGGVAKTAVATKTEDLTGLFSGWFDTTNAGPKTEAKSYESIAEDMKMKPEEVLFFSDNVLEIKAAVEANMKAVLVDRPGNAPVDEADAERYRMVKSLDEVEV